MGETESVAREAVRLLGRAWTWCEGTRVSVGDMSPPRAQGSERTSGPGAQHLGENPVPGPRGMGGQPGGGGGADWPGGGRGRVAWG